VDYERVLLNRLDHTIASLDERLVLLAPPAVAVPDQFRRCEFDLERHNALVEAVQRFRGSIYYEDGAIRSNQLSSDGLHLTPEDSHSWHLLLMNPTGSISACAWYREYDNRVYFDRLRLRQSELAHTPQWRDVLWRAVEKEISHARRDGLRYAEVGGWAVARGSRCTGEGLVLALATYGLGRIGGGVFGITTATVRHRSSTLLCRLGGSPLEVDGTVVPSYYDPRYQCEMEVIRFDSRAPHAKFAGLVEQLHAKLLGIRVIARPYWPLMRSRGFTPLTLPQKMSSSVPHRAAVGAIT
jgi:hypothetical protein